MAAKPGQIALDGQKPVFATGSPDGPVRSQSGPKGSAVVSKRSQSGTNPFLIPKNPPPGYIPLSGQYDSDRAGLLAQADEYEKQRKAIEDAGKRGNYRTKESQKRARAKMSDLKIKASNARSKALVYKRASEMFDDREKEAQRLKVLGETAQRARERDLRTLKKESDTAFDEVQADIEERQKVNEGLINSAAGFDASVGTRIDRVLPHATPAEAARLKELRRGGVNAASQGRPAGEIVEFEQSINQVITRIDARVAVDKGKGRDRANRRSLEDANERLAEADARLVAAGTPEAKAAAQKAKGKAQLDVEFARKAAGLGVGRGPSGGGGPKAMKPDAAGSKFAAIFKDARDNTLTDGGAIDPKDGLRGHSLEALVVGSFSNLHVNEAQRKVIWEVAEEMAAGIRTTGNPDSDRAAVKAKFESIREALGPELWTEETKTRVFLMLFGRGAGGLGA